VQRGSADGRHAVLRAIGLRPLADARSRCQRRQPAVRFAGAGPASSSTPAERAFASRIVIPSLHIDLPVVAGDLAVPGNVGDYPLCDVAMYLPEYVQPGEAGTTYIYAHAQRGMFAPLLKASLTNDGAALIGSLVEVYTSDDVLHLYELTQVKRHATDLSITDIPAGDQQLVLQTSEGVSGTIPKLQVAAQPVSVLPASAADANPTPHPRVCLPGSSLPPG
jgi:sortase (surface protein transpeptidase)